jgi:putative ABC transport system permease protein
MSLWRQFTRGFGVLIHRHAADKDVADEVEHYLEQATSAWVARGLSPQDARRTARLELGSPSVAREQVRSSGWEQTIPTLFTDLQSCPGTRSSAWWAT